MKFFTTMFLFLVFSVAAFAAKGGSKYTFKQGGKTYVVKDPRYNSKDGIPDSLSVTVHLKDSPFGVGESQEVTIHSSTLNGAAEAAAKRAGLGGE